MLSKSNILYTLSIIVSLCSRVYLVKHYPFYSRVYLVSHLCIADHFLRNHGSPRGQAEEHRWEDFGLFLLKNKIVDFRQMYKLTVV
jgi:hypothetical protein